MGGGKEVRGAGAARRDEDALAQRREVEAPPSFPAPRREPDACTPPHTNFSQDRI